VGMLGYGVLLCENVRLAVCLASSGQTTVERQMH
jgi:hypothetical protein